MEKKELPYEETKQETMNQIVKNPFCILATTDGNKVRAGQMRLVWDGEKYYCFTHEKSRKIDHIQKNNNVAMYTGIYQIEGTAELKGNPSLKKNSRFIEAYKRTQPEAYEKSAPKYFNMKSGIELIEITPKRIASYTSLDTPLEMWERGEMLSYFTLLNLEKKKAYKLDGLQIYDDPIYRE
jgi:general stress protein 26